MSTRQITERLQAEFLEMPGMRLTVRQVQRLCGLDEAMCRAVLTELVNTRFLRANADGTYARLTDGLNDRPRPARAHLPENAFRKAS
jgi:hypothetical protein